MVVRRVGMLTAAVLAAGTLVAAPGSAAGLPPALDVTKPTAAIQALPTFTANTAITVHYSGGRRMALVVTTCPACGKVAISLDGKTGKLVDTRSKTLARKVVLVQPGGGKVIEAIIRLYVAQARPVYVDGVAVTSR